MYSAPIIHLGVTLVPHTNPLVSRLFFVLLRKKREKKELGL